MQLDWGGGYEKLNSFFQRIGIAHKVSCPHAHQQNGAAERKHRHIVEVGLSLLANTSMPLKYWDEAFLTATYLINLLPSKVIGYETPMERLLHEKLNYNSLRVFGCACWPNLRPYNARKLSFRSTRCAFLGYSSMHKGFKCVDIATGRIYISRDIIFDESIFLFAQLHPNASAQLKKELIMLPSHLLNSGGVDCVVPNVTNVLDDSYGPQDQTRGDPVQNNGETKHIEQADHSNIEETAGDPGDRSQADTPTGARESGGDPMVDMPDTPATRPNQSGSSLAPTRGWGGVASSNHVESTRFPSSSSPRMPRASVLVTTPTPGAPGSCTVAAGSHVAPPEVTNELVPDDSPLRRTRAQHGIVKPKHYTDGTVRYGLFCATREPENLEEALGDPKWK